MTDLTHWIPPDLDFDAPLQGRSARLERLDPAHHAAVLYNACAGQPDLWTYLAYGPFASSASYHRWMTDAATWDHTRFYAIRDRASGHWAGVASYLRDVPAHGTIEIGNLLFSQELQRTPAATEAICLMIGQVFDAGYRRVEWKCDARNMASRRAAQRFGFSHEGVFRQHMIVKGGNRDTAWFAMIDTEWPALKEAYAAWLAPSNFTAEGRQIERLSDFTRLIRAADDPAVGRA
jgi:RimJ/RimL family protein N-acetyltransferase